MPASLSRVQLVEVDSRILSSYNGQRSKRPLTLRDLKGLISTCPQDVASAILELHLAVAAADGVLRITDLHRSPESSAEGHAKYLRWKKDRAAGVKYDSKIHKDAYVAPPGESWHNAARAIDVHVVEKYKEGGVKKLRPIVFPNLPADKNLDKLWEIAKPLGFTPIIREPDEWATESWHFDFRGEWAATYDERKKEAIMGACLDHGLHNRYFTGNIAAKELQSQIWRCGQNIGKIDGDIGGLTRGGLSNLGLPLDTKDASELWGLLSKPAGSVQVERA